MTLCSNLEVGNYYYAFFFFRMRYRKLINTDAMKLDD